MPKTSGSERRTHKRVLVRPSDQRDLDRIADTRGWTYAETVSRLLRHFLRTDPQFRGDRTTLN